MILSKKALHVRKSAEYQMGQATCSFPVFLVQGKKKTTVHKVFGRLGECDILCAWSLACRTEPLGSSDDQLSGWRSGSQRKRAVGVVRDICSTCFVFFYKLLCHTVLFCFVFFKVVFWPFAFQPGRVPIVPFSIPEKEDDEYIYEKPSKQSDSLIHTSLSR